MHIIEKVSKVLSIIDIVFSSLVVALYIVLCILESKLPGNIFDYMFVAFLIFFLVSIFIILTFEITIIARAIHCKKALKERNVIVTHIINVIFVFLTFVFVMKSKFLGSSLFFIFAWKEHLYESKIYSLTCYGFSVLVQCFFY